MSVLTIVTGQDTPILRTPCEPLTNFGADLMALCENMTLTMRQAKGVGIAAPQVGQNLQVFIIAKEAFNPEQSSWRVLKGPEFNPKQDLPIINPQVTIKNEGSTVVEEGCLSIPNRYGYVPRAKRVVILAQNINGEAFKLQAKGFLARVIQHEFDHLQGTLICDKFISASV